MRKKPKNPRVVSSREALGLGVAFALFPNADDLYALHQAVRAGREPEETQGCDAATWARYARNTRRAAVVMYGMILGPVDWKRDGHRSVYAQLSAGLAAGQRLTASEREQLKTTPPRRWPQKIRRYGRMVQLIYRVWAKAMNEAIAKKQSSPRSEQEGVADVQDAIAKAFDAASPDDQLRFFVVQRTIRLCCVLTGRYPSQLLRRARQGDLRALDEIVRLDRRLFYDAGIQRRIRGELWNTKSAYVRVALRAVKSKPAPMKKAALKARLGAMAQAMANGSPLFEEPGLRRMFDALARKRSGGTELIDTSLPQAQEALRKSVLRERRKLDEQFRSAGGQK